MLTKQILWQGVVVPMAVQGQADKLPFRQQDTPETEFWAWEKRSIRRLAQISLFKMTKMGLNSLNLLLYQFGCQQGIEMICVKQLYLTLIMNEGGHWAPLTGQQVEWIQGPDTTDTKLGGWAELAVNYRSRFNILICCFSLFLQHKTPLYIGVSPCRCFS